MKLKRFLFLVPIVLCSCGQESDLGELDGISTGEHRLFISSQSYSGNLSGITGANSKCQSLASGAGLQREYVAIISSNSSNIKDRLSLIGPVYQVSGSGKELLIKDPLDIWDSVSTSLVNAISVDETGASVSSLAWTGSFYQGDGGIDDCNGWMSSSSAVSAFSGDPTRTDEYWIQNTNDNCSNSYRLYCISL